MVDYLWVRSGAWIWIFVRIAADAAICWIVSADIAAVLQPGCRARPAPGAFAAYPCSRIIVSALRGRAHGYDHSFSYRCAHCVALECGTVYYASPVSTYPADDR